MCKSQWRLIVRYWVTVAVYKMLVLSSLRPRVLLQGPVWSIISFPVKWIDVRSLPAISLEDTSWPILHGKPLHSHKLRRVPWCGTAGATVSAQPQGWLFSAHDRQPFKIITVKTRTSGAAYKVGVGQWRTSELVTRNYFTEVPSCKHEVIRKTTERQRSEFRIDVLKHIGDFCGLQAWWVKIQMFQTALSSLNCFGTLYQAV